MKTLAEKIAVMQAALEGKKIQFFYLTLKEARWRDESDNAKIIWDWSNYDFRVKPESREFWINEYGGRSLGEIFLSREEADRAGSSNRTRCIHVREVMEGE